MRADPVHRGQPARTQHLGHDVGQRVGAALVRGAQVIPARWGHHRVQRGQQRRPRLRVDLPPYGHHGADPGHTQAAAFERAVRIGVGAVRVEVGGDALTRLLQLGRGDRGGQVGQDLIEPTTPGRPTRSTSSSTLRTWSMETVPANAAARTAGSPPSSRARFTHTDAA